MRIASWKLATAVKYLAAFGAPDDPIVFSPQGRLLRISVHSTGRYGEYYLEPIEQLDQRFAIRLRPVREFAQVVTTDEIRYSRGNRATFAANGSVWHFNFCDPGDARPEVQPVSRIRWDGTFADSLKLAKTCTRDRDETANRDCVRVETKETRRSVVAISGATMMTISEDTWGRRDAIENEEAGLLIGADQLGLVGRVCEVRQAVEIAIGLHFYSITSGRRVAILPLRAGVFPKWPKILANVLSESPVGRVLVDRRSVETAAKQLRQHGERIRVRGRRRAIVLEADTDDDAGGNARIEIPCETEGKIGPVKLLSKFVTPVASLWPHDQLDLTLGRRDSPVIFQSPELEPTITAVIMPQVETV